MKIFVHLFLSILLLGYSSPLFAQCADGESEIQVIIVGDDYPNETTWEVKDVAEQILASGNIDGGTVCVLSGECLTFTIYDAYGDGICCGFGDGSYQVLLDGAEIATGGDFDDFEETSFNCPEGSNCGSLAVITEGEYIASLDNHWYSFTPATTGMYDLFSCGQSNTCNSKLWLYDYCSGLQWDDSNQGTIYYSADGCDDDGASISAALEAGKTYYIRVGDVEDGCENTPINWTLSFIGEITGCTDPTACNYNPLATVSSGDCIFPGDPDCTDGPDLLILEDVLVTSMYLTTIENNDDCLIEEGCISGYGMRDIIRFTTHIENIGERDYYIGQPPASIEEANDQWEWDACHGHWHYEGYAEYILFDENGVETPIGFKNGFCVMDLNCSYGGGTAKYGCGNQGITAHCGDIYGSGLTCQWIDITDLAAGEYTFVVRTNWDQSPDALGANEMDYDNNWGQACIEITRDAVTNAPSFAVVEGCEAYVDCLGVPYGSAQPDCNGECNGLMVQGDLSLDTELSMQDMYIYMEESINDLTASNCNDLNADGMVSVTDAALMLDCILHADVTPPGHNHIPCEFPFSITNPNDSAMLRIGEYNLDGHYIDIEMKNPQSNALGFEFTLEGVTIGAVQNLIPNYYPTLMNSDSEIIGLSIEEDVVLRSETYQPFIRVFFTNTTGDEICIGSITAVVNDEHEEITTKIEGECINLSTVDVEDLSQNPFHVFAAPNPFVESTTLHFFNPNNDKLVLSLMDVTGKEVQRHIVIGTQFTLNRNGLNAGVYLFKLTGEERSSTGKLMIIE